VAYALEWTARALRELRKLDASAARRILTAVARLAGEPRPPGARALVGEPSGVFRLRVGDYRVIYQVDDDRVVVTVARVAHRREA
jgi:mRNA interferase RelE/StbE